MFTHLDEDYQNLWLEELRRITQPNGTVVLTIQGPKDVPFPDFYHTTFHDPGYVFDHWARYLSLRAYISQGSLDDQEMIVFRPT